MVIRREHKFRSEVQESEDQRVDAMTDAIDDRAWAPATAHQFFADPIYSPEEIKAIGEAFDGAWARIAPTAGARPESIQVARNKLADVLLRLAKDDGDLDPERLEEAAVERMLAAPRTL
jgi:hypothetical protein